MLRAIELCAGAGGLSLGLESAGFQPVALVDNDPYACATLRMNRPLWNIIEADLTHIDLSPWRGVDLLSGGLPCPPYSLAGKRLGAEDERDLFPAMLNIVGAINPRAILIENVRGLMQSKFGDLRDRLAGDLLAMGYRSYWALLNAADFNTPQNRHRVFLIGLRNDVKSEIQWPLPTESKPKTVGETIGNLMSERGWKNADAWANNANRIAPTIVGGSKKHGGPDLGPTNVRREWASLGVDGTGVANSAPSSAFDDLPRLTARMIARIQGFPDKWQFCGGKTQQCRQIGNALPPPLATSVAASLGACLR